jgi:phage repressor protein C with HTH and peptisase S24 domain
MIDDGFTKRFRAVLERVGMLQRSAELTGYSTDQIAKWRDGKAKAPFAPLVILCDAAGIPLDWLASGRGTPDFSGEKTPIQQPDDDIVLVPVLSVNGSAGPGADAREIDVIDRIPFSRALMRRRGVNPDNVHALTARGDSMAPTIVDGQVVFVDRSIQRVREDAIYLVSIDHDIRIKRIQKGMGGALTLRSDNPNYEAELLSPADAEKLRVEGRVFWAEQLL